MVPKNFSVRGEGNTLLFLSLNMNNYTFPMVKEYPDGGDDSMVAELRATGFDAKLLPTPVTLPINFDMAMVPEIHLPLDSQNHSQHAINELMKLYHAGVKRCVLKFPKSFPYDHPTELDNALNNALTGLMTERDEAGKLRKLTVYFVKEKSFNLGPCVFVAVVALLLYSLFYNHF